LAMIAAGVGVAMNMIASNFVIFCVGRVLYGIGYGLSTPFIAAAIMHWYSPRQQVTMDSVNGIFPYATNIIVFGLTIPLVSLFGNSWKASLSVWGFLILIIFIFWSLGVKDEGPLHTANEAETKESGVFANIIKRKEILLLLFMFVCDYTSYSVATALLPTYLQRDYGVSIELANNLTMIFPISGVIAIICAFFFMQKTGRRKPLICLGQISKVVGLLMIYFGGIGIVGYCGIALLGVGVSVWAPAMLVVPMDLKDMTPSRVGAAFSLMMSCGFAGGAISPVIVGWLSSLYSYGFAICLCAIPCALGFIASLIMRETGPVGKNVI